MAWAATAIACLDERDQLENACGVAGKPSEGSKCCGGRRGEGRRRLRVTCWLISVAFQWWLRLVIPDVAALDLYCQLLAFAGTAISELRSARLQNAELFVKASFFHRSDCAGTVRMARDVGLEACGAAARWEPEVSKQHGRDAAASPAVQRDDAAGIVVMERRVRLPHFVAGLNLRGNRRRWS